MAEEEKDPKKESKDKIKDESKREFKDTQQEVMWDLKIKTNNFLEKLKEQQKKNKVHFGRM